MSEESEWRDVNPITADLPNKGRTIILLIAGGLAIGLLGIVGMRLKPVGLAVGAFAFFTGIGMIIRAVKSKVHTSLKPALIITVAGFLMLLAHPRFGLVAGFAMYFLVVGAIILIVTGISKAIKLAWDLGKRP
jgi:O-antigen/teichoic acid export membrane protein